MKTVRVAAPLRMRNRKPAARYTNAATSMSGLVSLRRIKKIDDHKNIVYPSTIHTVSLTTGCRASNVSSCSILLWNRISSCRKNSKQPDANNKIANTTKWTVGYSQYGDGFMV